MPLLPPRPGGHPLAPPPLAGPPPLPAGPLAPPPNPMGGPPGMPSPGGGMGAPGFPTTDPSQVSGLLAPLEAAQAADQGALQQQQMQATVLALIDAMRNAPNPAAQAAVSEPGYPTPPPAGDPNTGML
jgi:hypothetical protein